MGPRTQWPSPGAFRPLTSVPLPRCNSALGLGGGPLWIQPHHAPPARRANLTSMLIQRVHLTPSKHFAASHSLEFMWRQTWGKAR